MFSQIRFVARHTMALVLAGMVWLGGSAVAQHTADQDEDFSISLPEALRVIQLFNSPSYHCDATGEDGYAPGPGDQLCAMHDSDYASKDWRIDLTELLRLIQYFNIGEYHCDALGEGGFAPGPGSRACATGAPVITMVVDPTLVPDYAVLPPVDGVGDDRPVAAIEDDFGTKANFIANELVLSTDDPNVLNAFLLRWGGTLLMTLDPTRAGIEIDPQYLVRIDTTLADTLALIDDLHAILPDQDGDHRVSSQQGLELLAAASAEAVDGLGVGVNWVGLGDDIDSRFTPEGPGGPGGFNSAGATYSNNSFNWNHLDAGSTQDIGVTEAWWLLEQVGRLDSKVKVAILDGGFFNTNDLPPSFIAISNIPFVTAMGTANPGGCGGGGTCTAHGTKVAGAAFGVPGNGFGAAGPAGPVADPILVLTHYDYFTSMFAVGEALFLGAQILNMSYSARVPAVFSWTVLPFESVTAGAAVAGRLLFASAGNSGDDVDEERCFIVCWERALHTPCENIGVNCVGGLQRNSKSKDGQSSFGAKSVDIFAPFTVLVGPEDAGEGSDAQSASGTSYSSPYAAGVAALIWAANPSLNGSQVRSILIDTAHSSPDENVNRYVNAFAAVKKALGSVIHIQSPANGLSFGGGTSITFRAFATEGEHGTPTITWSSSRDGAMGTGAEIFVNDLSAGSHAVTARATYPDSFVATDSATVSITNSAPVVTITAPANGANFFQGQAVTLTGTSFDANNPPSFDLSDGQVSWFVDTVLLGMGHAQTIPAGSLTLGAHTIRFEGTDGSASDSDSVSITINANPVDLPPDAVNITAPTNGTTFNADMNDGTSWYKQVTLTGNASDPEDGTLSGTSLVWTTRIDGGAPVTLGTGTSLSVKLRAPACFGNPHQITLTATDSAANSSTTSVGVSVSQLCK